MPLAIGCMWVYETRTDSLASKATAADTSRVVDTEIRDGKAYYVLEIVTPDGVERVLTRQAGQDILVSPVMTNPKSQDPFQDWMDRITAASLPWKIADFDAHTGCEWVEIDAESESTLGGSDVIVRCEVYGSSRGRESVGVPEGDYADAYHGESTTRLRLSNRSGS